MDLDSEAVWIALFSPSREALGFSLAAAGDSASVGLRAAWLVEVERRPHEADRLLQREPLHDVGLRALLGSAAALMYDDASAALRCAEEAARWYSDPMQPLYGWASCLEGQAHLELGWPARALPRLQAALRVAHRDEMPLLQLDALRALARLHQESGEQDLRDKIMTSAAPLVATYPALPASDSLRRLQARVEAHSALLGGPWPTLTSNSRVSQRLACALQNFLMGDGDLRAEVQALRLLQSQQYWPLKWQVELGQLEGSLAARYGHAAPATVLPGSASIGLSRLQASVIEAGHARLCGRPLDVGDLSHELRSRGLMHLASRLALVLAEDAQAVTTWWHSPGRDAVDAVWLSPQLLPLWPALLALPDPRRNSFDQQALRALGERMLALSRLSSASSSQFSTFPYGLTPREREVLHLIGEDWSNAQIAAKLFVSEATIKTHINRVYAKLGLRNRQEAQLRARTLSSEN